MSLCVIYMTNKNKHKHTKLSLVLDDKCTWT